MDKAKLTAEINETCDRIYSELETLEGVFFYARVNLLMHLVELWSWAELEGVPNFIGKLKDNAPVV